MDSKPRHRRMTTIQDIAADLGLSAMTVSRALNDHPDVKDETRQRVKERARELNYRANRWARSLVTRRSHLIGAVIPEISHTFFAEIIGGVQREIADHDYTLILCHSGGKVEDERREIDMLVGSRVDGLIIASSCSQDDYGMFLDLQNEGAPFVLIDRFFPDFECPRVRTDDIAASRLCVDHLIQLGHRRIGYVGGHPVSAANLRLQGYREAMAAAGLEVPDGYIVEGGFAASLGREAGRRLLQVEPRPTAVATVNDTCAMGVVQAVRDIGLRVPDDVSVTGVGCIESDYLPAPFMTTTEWSREELGRGAARMLLTLIDGGALDSNDKIVAPSLLERISTAPPPAIIT